MKIILRTALRAAALALVIQLQAATTYVDATDGAAGNTKLTNGAAWSPQTANQGTTGDGLWARRAFGNGATIYQNAANGNTDNAHRLVTTVTNLTPNTYEVYAYMWRDTSPAGWRMGAALENNPGGELPLYIAGDPGLTQLYESEPPGSALGTPVYSTNLPVNPFKSAVMVGESNRRLVQIPLGQVTVTGNSFQVFIDDFNAMTDSSQRTWYDGVGYAVAGAGTISGPTFLETGDLKMSLYGNARGQYAQESVASLAPPITWVPLITNLADPNGLVNFTNTPADSQAFYRVRDVSIPAQVSGLTATAGNAQVSLSWAASSFATSYNVKRSTVSGGPYTTVTNVTATSFLNTGLANGTTYYFVVSALNGNGESIDSTEANATPMAPPPPAAPAGLTAAPGHEMVSLGWAASTGATSYNVKRSTVSGGPYVVITNVTTTNFVNTALVNGTTYYFVVSALNANGESVDSVEASATPAPLPPAVPSGLTATPGNAKVTLSWTPSPGATDYNVKRSTVSGGPYTAITNVATASFVDTNLINDATYYYVVSALNVNGESVDSLEASATPTAQIVIPLVYAVENTGAGFAPPPLPSMADLPIILPLPDVFMWSATNPTNWTSPTGRSTNFADWSVRRAEIKAEIEHYEIGYKPPVDPSMIFASVSGSGTTRTLTVRVTNIVSGVARTLTLTSAISLPASSGTFPAIIGMNSPNGSISLGGRAIATINYQHNQVTVYNSASNADPYYQLYAAPYSPALNIDNTGQYSAWAWGVSRLIDGLYKLNGNLGGGVQINLQRLGVTGCSYAGKMALFSGALDERIALTIPQESGGGGVPNWRYSFQVEPAGSVEGLSQTSHQWFSESMFAFGGANTAKLPHDHHELLAMIAPRAVLATGNPGGGNWLSNPSCFVSCKAVERVYEAFGISDRFGYNIEGGKSHCARNASLDADVYAFLDKFLLGLTNVDTASIRHVPSEYSNIDHSRWTAWWGTTNPVFPEATGNYYKQTFETECGTVGSAWDILTDANASNGKYVTVKAGLNSSASAPVDPTNHVVIPFTMTNSAAANFLVSIRVNCANANDDSIYVKMDEGSWTTVNGLPTGGWTWGALGTYNLSSGSHTFTIAYREDGARLDKITISDYLFAPTGMGDPAQNICP